MDRKSVIRRVLLCTCGLWILLLAGCRSVDQPPQPFEGASITGATQAEDQAGTFVPFTVPVERAEDPVGIDFGGVARKGGVRVQLADAQGRIVWQESVDATGPFAVNQPVRPVQAAEYRLGLVWDGPVVVGVYETVRELAR